jgi:choline-sulfatase
MTSQRPNFLFIMADQLTALALPTYGHRIVKAPNIDDLARQGVVFENAYCNFPLCAPSRYSMLTGQLASRIGAYDNAAELPAAVPTVVHYLRMLGYRTCLSGKMHFVGPDQLHGFEERLTTDIYPSDFGWTANPQDPLFKPYGGGMSMRYIIEAGLCDRSLQIDYDDDVETQAIQKIYDYARAAEAAPFFLVVSFTHPHSPFTTTPEFWDLYNHEDIDLPSVPPIPVEEKDPHSRYLYYLQRSDEFCVTDEHIRTARHAYYGMVSYVDAKVGRLLKTLERAGLRENTIVVFTADHGEMLGERGMWYKYTFFEGSMRVPLMWSGAKLDIVPHRERRAVSLLDVFPTILDLATNGERPALVDPIDGHSLVGLLGQRGDDDVHDEVRAEFLAETTEPRFMLREGRYKYIYSASDAPLMFDLVEDPRELENVAGDSRYAEIEKRMVTEIQRQWNAEAIAAMVLDSQRRRLFLQSALEIGKHTSWDFQPFRDASKQYVRRGAGSAHMKSLARLPYVKPASPDYPRAIEP